ncbi:MAG: hypothetical protein E7448_04500 [Ruminococcaceae bacterium]|nr:hypothetical protein [Oscillospiraceae bacterium]
MGAVKNLFVRIGGDASGSVKAFKDASSAGSNAQKSIKKAAAGSRQSIREAFSASVPSIKQYTAQMARTKEAHQVATQNVGRLEDKVNGLKNTYETVKNATAGLDLSKPFNETVAYAEQALVKIEARRKKLEQDLRTAESSPKKGNADKTAKIQNELSQLAEKSKFAEARLADLNRIADELGESNIGYASTKGLEQLKQQIQAAENELRTTKMVADETGRSLQSMGVKSYIKQVLPGIGTTAAHAAGTGVQKLWGGLKKIGSAVGHKIASLPAKLREIGRSAASGNGGLNKMVQSIRNMGIVSLGMRVVSSVLGEVKSIITGYITQNEQLNTSVTALKTQLGEALAPAIHLVVGALEKLMPMVTRLSNGISHVFTSLFGDIKSTTNSINQAVEETSDSLYGFDQITKESDDSEDKPASSTPQLTTQPAWVKKLTGWLQQIKKAFKAGDWNGLGKIMADGINSAFKALDDIDVGVKVGTFINNALRTIRSFVTGVDFSEIGSTLGRKFTQMIERINWNKAGETIGATILALPKMLVSFVLNTNWAEVAQSISECLMSALKSISEWIKETDWLKLGNCIVDFIANVDWLGFASNLYSLLGEALTASVKLLWGALDNIATRISNYLGQRLAEDGALGILSGISQGIADLFGGPTSTQSKERTRDYLEDVYGITPPKAARGTIVSSPTKLEVGEDGTEAVVPLEKHTEWMDVVATKLAAKAGGGATTRTSVTIPIYLGNRKITEYTIKDINQITRENGVCPIHV